MRNKSASKLLQRATALRVPHSYRASYIATEKIAHAPILSKLTLRIGAPLSRITNFTLGNSELEYKVYHYSIM